MAFASSSREVDVAVLAVALAAVPAAGAGEREPVRVPALGGGFIGRIGHRRELTREAGGPRHPEGRGVRRAQRPGTRALPRSMIHSTKVLLALSTLSPSPPAAPPRPAATSAQPGAGEDAAPAAPAPDSIYAPQRRRPSAESVDLARYEGKVTLFVNVASRCGYTPQYAAPEAARAARRRGLRHRGRAQQRLRRSGARQRRRDPGVLPGELRRDLRHARQAGHEGGRQSCSSIVSRSSAESARAGTSASSSSDLTGAPRASSRAASRRTRPSSRPRSRSSAAEIDPPDAREGSRRRGAAAPSLVRRGLIHRAGCAGAPRARRCRPGS